jgi:hypothetical protein
MCIHFWHPLYMYIVCILVILNERYYILNLHAHVFDRTVVIVCLCTYIHDDDLVEVETCCMI